jgi:hypothetical protein
MVYVVKVRVSSFGLGPPMPIGVGLQHGDLETYSSLYVLDLETFLWLQSVYADALCVFL